MTFTIDNNDSMFPKYGVGRRGSKIPTLRAMRVGEVLHTSTDPKGWIKAASNLRQMEGGRWSCCTTQGTLHIKRVE